MAFVGSSLSGSQGTIAISGSQLQIANRTAALWPTVESKHLLWVSGTNSADFGGGTSSPYGNQGGDTTIGGDMVVSGVFMVDAGEEQSVKVSFGHKASTNLFENQGSVFMVSGSVGKMDADPESDFDTANCCFLGDLKVSGGMQVGQELGATAGASIVGSIHLTRQGKSYLVAGSNISISSGTNGQISIAASGGGSGSPGGSDTQIQYNDGGSFGGTADLTFNETTGDTTVGASTGDAKLFFRDSGNYIWSPSDGKVAISADGTGQDAIFISASNAAGGIEFEAGTGGVETNTSGYFAVTSSMNHQHAINFFASAGGMDFVANGATGEDIDIKCISGAVNITSNETIADAIVLSAGNGGIDVTAAGTSMDIDINSTGGSVNITGGEAAVTDSVVIQGTGVEVQASHTTHGLKLGTETSGVPVSIGHTTSEVTVGDNLTVTGDLTVNGTTTTIDSTNLNIKDPFVLLGDGAQAANANSGIVFVSGSSTGATRPDVIFARKANDVWGLGSIASNSGSITAGTSMTSDIGFSAGSLTGSATVTSPKYFSTAAMDISSTGALTIDSVGTDNVSIATEAAAKTVQLGNAASTAVNLDALAITLTSVNALSLTDGTGTVALGGTGAFSTSAVTTMALDATSNITIDSSGGTIGIGTDDVNQAINIGTNGNRAITVGEDGNASCTVVLRGEGGITLDSGATGGVGLTGDIIPSADVEYNLGSSTQRFANVYTGDLHLRNDRGNWTMIEESSYLSLTNNDTGKVYKILMEEVDDDNSPDTTSNESKAPSGSSKKKRSL